MNLKLANTDAVKFLLGIKEKGKIIKITPNSYSLSLGNGLIKTTFFTYDRVLEILKPIITKMEIADEYKHIENKYEALLHYSGLELKNKYPQIYLTLNSFNPDTNSDSSLNGALNATWATIHDAASGTNNANSGVCLAALAGANYNIYRMGNAFNTASLADDLSILEVTIEIFHLAANFGNVDSTTYDIVAFTPADPAAIVGDDYDQFGTTVFATKTLASITQDAYNTYTLDANGRAQVSLTGYSSFGYRIGRDTINSAPTDTNRVDSTARNGANPEKLNITSPDTDEGGIFLQ